MTNVVSMDIPYSRWFAAVQTRRSRRVFDPNDPIEEPSLAELDRTCKEFAPFPHARACLVRQPSRDIFKGIVGGYGKIAGAPAFIAFIGDMSAPSVQEEVGYLGEGIVLEATALGLDTCWVGGFFKPQVVSSLVEIGQNERVLAVTPVGHAKKAESPTEKLMTGFGLTHRRRSLESLVSGTPASHLPVWARVAVEAARLAPSAVNRQPWGFRVSGDALTVFVRSPSADFGVSKRLDCGIAMLHVELAALSHGRRGKWESLDPPLVARFTVS